MAYTTLANIDRITHGLASEILALYPGIRNALFILEGYVLIAEEKARPDDIAFAYNNYLRLLEQQHNLLANRYSYNPSPFNKLMVDASAEGLGADRSVTTQKTKVIRMDSLMGYIHQSRCRFEDILADEDASAADLIYMMVLNHLSK